MEERRLVTVLFCDVTNSTALASQVDEEDWAEIISGAFPLLIDPVERFGGTVARLMGDAVLAFFGAPTSHEDDPVRAVLAALEILDGIRRYREEIRRIYGLDFNVRIGINTGPVVTQEVGSQAVREYTALGDAVNVAARMEQLAEPGTIQVAAATRWLTREYFDFETLGAIQVKGKDEPVEAYRVLGRVRESRTRSDNPATPTVGRQREMDLLQYSLEELKAGRGGAVALVGEAGLGKSRLVRELRAHWLADQSNSPDSWIEDRLVSFEASTPYGLLRRRLAQELEISDGATPSEVRTKLGGIPAGIGPEARDRAAQAVTQLFSWAQGDPSPTVQHPTLVSGDDFRHELAVVAERSWRTRIARVSHAVYVIDDFHCADPASVDILEQMIPDLIDTSLLVVLAMRPERQAPAWGLHERLVARLGMRYLTLELAPLDPPDATALVDTLLPGAQMPAGFQRMLLDRIGGNPLFAEEIVRLLVEQGVLYADPATDGAFWRVSERVDLGSIDIPTSLQGLIQERMDRLDADAKETLQLAAVLGRDFSVEELRVTSGQPERIASHLAALERAMLIHPVRRAGPQQFEFHHALTWEAAYRSLLRRHRARLHRHVGERLEQLYGEQASEHSGLLAFHFAEAGDERAIPYAISAGDEALALYAPEEAVEHYSRAIDLARKIDAESQSVRAIWRRGSSLLTLGEFEQSREDLECALELAQRAEDQRLQWQLLTDIGDLWEGIDYQQSGTWRRKALDLAESLGDELLIADSLARSGNWYTNVEQIDEARGALTRALSIFEQHGDLRSEAHVLDLLGTLEDIAGDVHRMLGYWQEAAAIFEALGDKLRLSSTLAGISFSRGIQVLETVVGATQISQDEAVECAHRALDLARSIGWKSGEAYALLSLSIVAGWQGRYSEALETAEAGLKLAVEIQHREWTALGHCARAMTLLDLLASDGVLAALMHAHEAALTSGSGHWKYLTASFLGSYYVKAGMLDRAAALLREMDSDGPAPTVGRRRLRLARAELALADGRTDEANLIVESLYATASNLQHRGDIPSLALLQGRALAALGRIEEALARLDEARLGAEVRGLPPLLWRAELERGRALRQAGRHDEARQALGRAQWTVETLANNVADEPLRLGFLDRAGQLIAEAGAS